MSNARLSFPLRVAPLGLSILLVGLASCQAQSPIVGHWVYASGESEGKTTSVSGDLKFTADGKFDDSRRIGGIGGFRKGTYAVEGDKLKLTYDAGKGAQTYSFSFGTSKDVQGKQFATLLLRGTGLSFVLTKKE